MLKFLQTEDYNFLLLGDTGTRNLPSLNELNSNPNILAPFVLIKKSPCLLHSQKYVKLFNF